MVFPLGKNFRYSEGQISALSECESTRPSLVIFYSTTTVQREDEKGAKSPSPKCEREARNREN